jgi:hypothetical protein
MLNPPTFIEHNNDSAMNGTSLKRLPPKSSNQHFNKKKWNRFSRRKLGLRVASQMVNRNHVLHAYDLYVNSCD